MGKKKDKKKKKEQLAIIEKQEHLKQQQKPKKKYWGVFAAGFLWGITFTFIFGVIFLRHSLIYEYESKLGYDETVKQIKTNAKNTKGWVVQFGAGCKMPKIKDGSKITIMKLCNGQYGSKLLNGDNTRKTSTIIPCTFSIYQKNGKTYLARVNVSLLGSLLGGEAAKIFTGKVTPEQEQMLQGVVK